MNKELTIHLCNQDHKVFLQDGFMPMHPPAGVLHKHAYTEIHVVFDGCVGFRLADKTLHLDAPSLLLIPGNIYHATSAENGTRSTAFQIDRATEKLRILALDAAIAHQFMEAINAGVVTGNFSSIHAYITLLCQLSFSAAPIEAKPIRDYRFLINEFFTQNYAADVQLCDLARVLNLSQRQAERLVIQYTGNSFARELASKRVAMAKLLQSTTQMPLSRIAQYVGYRTYAGFWKAMKKHGL